MNIFDSKTIKAIEANYIEQGAASSLELMYNASSAFVKWLYPQIKKQQHIIVICGIGNNGADGVLIASILSSKGFCVSIGIVGDPLKGTDEFLYQYKCARTIDSLSIFQLDDSEVSLIIEPNTVFIDAIFGIGLNRPATGIHSDIIKWMNDSGRNIYSVDVPSGMNTDKITTGPCINATATLSFHFPKKSFFHKENQGHIGEWQISHIGIQTDHVNKYSNKEYLITQKMVKSIIPSRDNYSHKGTYGHVIGLAGSEGMTGAAILMGKAVIQLGAGLCTICSDESSRTILQNSLPEALFGNYNNIALDIKYTYAIGPGLGKKNEVKTLLNRILDHTTRPVVIDADGLNIIAEDKTILAKLPPESILTPHPKEFENLFGTTVDTFARLKLQKESAQKYNCVIVLKDHHTTICTPQGEVYYNNTGNPGMAKGGSGDVLTGMIASLLAQGISSKKSAIAAVYLHGLAADIYCRQNHMATLTPTDIISQLSNALKETLSV